MYNDLRNLAKRSQRDVAEYLTMYALEGLLVRLAASDQAQDFVLKGGVLMAAFAARRPTRDLDFLASGFSNDVDECVRRIQAIAVVPLDDGLTLDARSVHGEIIRDGSDYTGVRVHFDVGLASARMTLHADVNFGDPIWPAPAMTELPRLLGDTVSLLAYPDHMVLAEKIVTALERGIANTRWRDFVDIDHISSRRILKGDDVEQSFKTVAEHRRVELQPLARVLDGMAKIAQPKWIAWRRKQRLEDSTPESFDDLLARCLAFVDPALGGAVSGSAWNASLRAWE
ncbi:MAG: nucleotidyl transferase AbiEii/AbiGii toxin family protein [Propionibacteriaceae bacterium]|nr:nucleotidyl transferase AbiEii/AbiGii toxin family protein [Propionibacteriaceae bacterium]